MSYQVLARKWRPRSFQEMVGQEHVLTALVNALDSGRLHHAYLLTGTRGVGKTTLARILARCLNCETGVTSTPCGECSSCHSVDEGRLVDLIEVDAASKTGVDDMRELLDNVQYAPSMARYKIYLIDEVHMLSKSSFNAMLKTLEEPPPHAIFLLATTDPQKLPPTILSRCLQFSLKNLTPERIVGHLQHVLAEESVPAEDAALWSLARAARGSMRDALSLTDQAIAYGNGALKSADVDAMLGSVELDVVYGLLSALADGQAAGLLERINQLIEKGLDCTSVLDALLDTLHRIAIVQHVPDAADNSLGDQELLKGMAASLTAEDVQYYYQMLAAGKQDFAVIGDPRAAFEMLLLRALSFRPAGASGPAASGGGEVPDTAKKPQAPEPAASVTPPPSDALAPVATAPPEPPPMPSPASEPVKDAAAAVVSPSRNDGPWLPEPKRWPMDYHRLDLPGLTGAVASQCELRSVNGHQLEFVMDEACAGLYDPGQATKLAALLSACTGKELNVTLVTGALQGLSPARWLQQQKEQAQSASLDVLRNDDVLKMLVEAFDARVDESSIEIPEVIPHETRH